jgi:hypothetical protein
MMTWEERLTGARARNASWSAPVLAEDWLYAANQNADVFVLRATTQKIHDLDLILTETICTMGDCRIL